MAKQLTIGLFGFGSVGSGIYRLLNKKNIPEIYLKTIVVKSPSKPRTIAAKHFSYQPKAILADEEINLVVELIDDADAAYQIVKQAIQNKKHVVTANKKMLAEHFKELLTLSKKQGVSLLYEASVCGSIPIIRTLEESFGLDELKSIKAISNGTCNYVLTRLFEKPQPFQEIITDAQKHGFAESDPTLDIDAWDSKFKLIISNYHAFGILNSPTEILNLGIRNIKPEDIQFAKDNNFNIKLIAHAKIEEGKLEAYVAPQFIPDSDAIAKISLENNAVQIDAEFAQQQVLQGKGAGSIPTASAVLSDIVSLLKNYAYAQLKAASLTCKLEVDKIIKIYISSTQKEDLDAFTLEANSPLTVKDSIFYKTGKISIAALKEQIEQTDAAVFIAVFPE